MGAMVLGLLKDLAIHNGLQGVNIISMIQKFLSLK